MAGVQTCVRCGATNSLAAQDTCSQCGAALTKAPQYEGNASGQIPLAPPPRVDPPRNAPPAASSAPPEIPVAPANRATAYQSVTATRTNPLAVASIITAFFCSPVGLILGIVALQQINRTGEQGKGLAIAGIVIGGISMFFAVIIAAAGSS